MQSGRVKKITTRGRIALDVNGRLIVADVQSGGGGWIGDEVEGPMHLGLQTWRHTRTGMLTVVHVIANDLTQNFDQPPHQREGNWHSA